MVIMFSHNDLDGIGCGVVLKHAYTRNTEVHYCSYGNV